jgi:ABC-type spermidine/putrescine transport system permease subunit II
VALIELSLRWLRRTFTSAPTWAKVLLVILVAPIVLFCAVGIGLIFELLRRVDRGRLSGPAGWVAAIAPSDRGFPGPRTRSPPVCRS